MTCTSGSSCLSWGFESNSVEGWAKSPTDPAITAVALNATSHSGNRSVAADVGVGWYSPTVTLAKEMRIRVPICPSSGTANVTSYWFSAWMRIDIPALSGSLPPTVLGVSFLNSDGSSAKSFSLNDYSGGWVQLIGQIPSGTGQIRYIELYGLFGVSDFDGFSGKWLIDDVRVTVN